MPRQPKEKELVAIEEVIEAEVTELEDSPLDAQFKLPLDEQKKLIVAPPDARIPDSMFVLAVKLARSARVPLWGVNIIPSKNGPKPYINADGVKFRLANDSRGVSSDDIEILKYPDGMGSTTIVKSTIQMGNGQTYNSLGAVKVDSQWNDANALLKAETKATRRAGYKAIASAVGMPMYDEDSDRGNGSVVEGNYRVVQNGAPKNIGQFLTWQQKNNITDADVLAVTKKDFEGEIAEKDIPEMYRLLSEWMAKRGEPDV